MQDNGWLIGDNSVVENSLQDTSAEPNRPAFWRRKAEGQTKVSLQFWVANDDVRMPVRVDIKHVPGSIAQASVFCWNKKIPEDRLEFVGSPWRWDLPTCGPEWQWDPTQQAYLPMYNSAQCTGYQYRSVVLPLTRETGIQLGMEWQLRKGEGHPYRPSQIQGIVFNVGDRKLPPYTFRWEWPTVPLTCRDFTVVWDLELDNSANNGGKVTQAFTAHTVVQEALARMQQNTTTSTVTGTAGMKVMGPPGSGIEVNLQGQVAVASAFMRQVQQTLTASTQVGQTLIMEAEKGRIVNFQLVLPFVNGQMGPLQAKAMPLSKEQRAKVKR